ncbi:hypothetical protein [Ancylobacter sp. 3268]|uniref:hypothetical protein n=1 Tax=Ancylobacter sp. 3268 TaxID=2817752 RepID=UPI00286C48DB|nr:hypothetical protein [Ancylobacter sp. 3268]
MSFMGWSPAWLSRPPSQWRSPAAASSAAYGGGGAPALGRLAIGRRRRHPHLSAGDALANRLETRYFYLSLLACHILATPARFTAGCDIRRRTGTCRCRPSLSSTTTATS